MKRLLFLFAFSNCLFVHGQILTDIAPLIGFNYVQHSAENFGNGLSFYDFDEDGWDDLTIPTDLDSIFFFRNSNGNLVKLPSLYAPGEVRQITWLDYDNDDDLDIFCTFHDNGIRMYANDGNFNFTDVTAAAGFDVSQFHAYGVSAADPDEDGDLDLYVAVYWLPTTLNPIPNLYYENQGNGTFIEKAGLLNIDNGVSSSFQGVWFDMNNDNKMDLHVVNDRHTFDDEMYVNMGGNTYQAQAPSLGIANEGHFPMCLSVSDYNNDGYQDVFKSDAGNGNVWNGVVQDYKLYRNNGGTSFTDVAAAVGVNHPAFAWTGLWVDYNNDSYEDLYVATSFIDTLSDPALSSVFFENNQGINFSNATDSIIGNITKNSYAAVKGDLNRDGFYDIVVLNSGSASNILVNGRNDNKYIRITTIGTDGNRMAIGALIKVYANNTCQSQTIFCGNGLCAQDSQHKIFGIGSATIVDSVIVTFPNGDVAKRFNLLPETDHIIRQKTTVQIPIVTGNTYNQFCTGDSISIGVSGLHNYLWNTGDTTSSIVVDSTGIYSFTAENAIGDTIFESYDLLLTFHDNIPHQTVITDALCGIGSFGSAEVIPTNPSSIDSIVWSDGTNGAIINNVLPGPYDYHLYSIYGCVDSGNVMINAQAPFTSQYFTTACTDLVGGTVQFYNWGGNPPFTYTFNATVVSDFIDNLLPGTYEVIIEDAAGCTDTVSFEIPDATTAALNENSNSHVNISYQEANLTICGVEQKGNYDVQIINGLGQRIALWTNTNNASCQTSPVSLETGWYIVVVRSGDTITTHRLSVD